MRITILGCGASSGVPLIGCECTVCTSGDPKNKRSRVSVLVETQDKKLLIDTSPDLYTQCLRENIHSVDAILYTHAHADHLHGIDDVRAFNFHRQGAVPAYMNAVTLEEVRERFGYVFREPPQLVAGGGDGGKGGAAKSYGWFRPYVTPHEVTPGEPFEAAGVAVVPFRQAHGKVDSLGYRIGDFAYSTDVNGFPPESEPFLQGLDLWVVDCLRPDPAPTHAHLAMTLGWIERFRPNRAVLTHLSHEFDYSALKAECPPGAEPAYDGMKITL